MSKIPPQQLHLPVLLRETLALLDPKPGESYLDLTAGYGGHARCILDKTGGYDQSFLVDRDQQAIQELEPFRQRGSHLLNKSFSEATQLLIKQEKRFDMILLDVGVSSPQVNQDKRGFSLKRTGPLDMRMDLRQKLTAEVIVNTYQADELAECIRNFGEERPSIARKIAEAIVRSRPILTTTELASLVAKVKSAKWQKVHPATKTFQALRIAVNGELEQLNEAMPRAVELLNAGGRIAVISFHSLEDRIVKDVLKEASSSGYEAVLRLLTRKPITPGQEELVHNPRSRSAKLRGAVKINI